MSRSGTIAERLKRVSVLILDVDGVLTDGSVIYTDAGAEIRRFHVRDGSALRWWNDAGYRSAIVSGRNSPIVERRAAELGVSVVMQGIADKAEALARICGELGFTPADCAAVGDDLPELPLLRRCAVGVAVGDACPELRAAADWVTGQPGGRGAVREAIEWILKAQGRWDAIVGRYAC